ncbi:reverse transcriptase domain-containing protein [Tanacetum coccineum]
MAEGEIDNLTMEQYLALTRGNQAPGVVKPEIRVNVNFKIKSQFMRELREDTFSGNKNDDAYEHVEQVLDIVSLFNIPGVSHDAVKLCVFPITLTGAAKRWVDRLPPRTVDSWDLLKKAFIQRYCPPSRIAKQLEEIRNFKQEEDETLYQAWEWYNDLLYKCPTHDINNHQKQKGSSSEGIAALMNKLENLDRDMKKLKENVHAIQIGCQNYKGAHLDKDYPLKEEVKSIEEAKYGEFKRPSPFSNGAKYHVGPPGYYTRMDNHPLVGEKRPSLEELMNKHLEESTPSLDQCKAMYANEKTPINNGQHEISISFNKCTQLVQTIDVSSKVLPCQLQPKELNPGNFTLPCTIRSLNFYAMADLGAIVNVIPKSIFENLKLARLKKTDMLIEMADLTKRSPIRIVENILVKIKKFLFPSDFMVMDMLNTRNETMILGRPFLATIHAEIDDFNKEISLGIRGDRAIIEYVEMNYKEGDDLKTMMEYGIRSSRDEKDEDIRRERKERKGSYIKKGEGSKVILLKEVRRFGRRYKKILEVSRGVVGGEGGGWGWGRVGEGGVEGGLVVGGGRRSEKRGVMGAVERGGVKMGVVGCVMGSGFCVVRTYAGSVACHVFGYGVVGVGWGWGGLAVQGVVKFVLVCSEKQRSFSNYYLSDWMPYHATFWERLDHSQNRPVNALDMCHARTRSCGRNFIQMVIIPSQALGYNVLVFFCLKVGGFPSQAVWQFLMVDVPLDKSLMMDSTFG